MASSLSNFVNNLAEGIHKIKRKDCDYFFEYENVKENSVKYKCLSWNKDYSRKIDKELKKRFKNKFTFSDNYINKFILLLRKGVYPYEYMDDWKMLMNQHYLEKKNFIATWIWKILQMQITCIRKQFAKTLK